MTVRLKILEVQAFERPYRLRIPFRFGNKTATGGKQAVISVRIRTEDGREATGWAAEALSAKWFDKNPNLTDDQNHHQLRRSIELAKDEYLASGMMTAFGLFEANYVALNERCATFELNPLIASFGGAMLDRAVFDALCRASRVSFASGMSGNLAGIVGGRLTPELVDFDIAAFLASLQPAPTIDIRHTVGLVDPLETTDQQERVNDGLPETLEEVIATYGCRYYKVKLSGNSDADLERLRRIARLLDKSQVDYRITLDGNEQFADGASISRFFAEMDADRRLSQFNRSALYLEQPVRRDRALNEPVHALAERIPVIIDESDGELGAFPRAKALGYTGVSSKTCKGFYKSILNAARAKIWNEGKPRRYFLSAEDLTCEPGISLQQDLALVSWLGLSHVEKNAHHFIDGFGSRPLSEQRVFLSAHGDLYREQDGHVRVNIENGKVTLGSLSSPGFGTQQSPEISSLEPMPAAKWPD